MSEPWGKIDRETGDTHHLAHHCADVAACFLALARLPVVRRRLEAATGRGCKLDETDLERLGVLVFLHDIGKLFPSFQAKGWPESMWQGSVTGHVLEGLELFSTERTRPAAVALHIDDLIAWFGEASESLLCAVLSHHGRPLHTTSDMAGDTQRKWRVVNNYDPLRAAKAIGALLPKWFPDAFAQNSSRLPDSPRLEHLLAGLTALADWVGSDANRFRCEAELNPNYMAKAHERAAAALLAFGLDVGRQRAALPASVGFETFSGFKTPNPQQALIGKAPLDTYLLILEAETGSGKTEAALWRYFRLFEAGRVDGLYFAVPTRAAAVQLHDRVCKASNRLFGKADPQPILAVPGYLKAGDVQGTPLPHWKVRWDDEGEAAEDRLAARWAAEHAKRYLAAQIAVGTVDQAMLGALTVKHAHLRAASLARSLLVIDEVHASDRFMTAIQRNLLQAHLAVGGYAMLMSATLGSVARAVWLGQPQPGLEEAISAPYPAVWCRGEERPRSVVPRTETEKVKEVAMETVETMAPDIAATRALGAARAGVRVLVIRNTVDRAIETLQALEAMATAADAALFFRVRDVVTLHHGRFAPADRKLLDEAVEEALTTDKNREPRGHIVVGTQTLEQSLDIDADLLITDLCPVDVLLQRIGRLHRHGLARPSRFEKPRCIVMVPEKGLERLLAPDFENGLGAWKKAGSYQGIYRDLSVLELTRRLIAKHATWRIPEMNRRLVEHATHPEAIAALHEELGERWRDYDRRIIAADFAQEGIARLSVIDWGRPFDESSFSYDTEERIRTRLGAEGARLTFAEPWPTGPFGRKIAEIVLPARWSIGLAISDEPIDAEDGECALAFSCEPSYGNSPKRFLYNRYGLTRLDAVSDYLYIYERSLAFGCKQSSIQENLL